MCKIEIGQLVYYISVSVYHSVRFTAHRSKGILHCMPRFTLPLLVGILKVSLKKFTFTTFGDLSRVHSQFSAGPQKPMGSAWAFRALTRRRLWLYLYTTVTNIGES